MINLLSSVPQVLLRKRYQLMLHSVLWSVLLCFSVAASANTEQVSSIFKQLSKSDIVRADFEQQKKLASLNKTFISSGSLTFAKNNGVLWQIKRPVQADLIVTQKRLVQKTQRTYSQIQIDQSPYSSVATLFLQLMSGDEKALAKNFNVVSADYRPTGWSVALTPKSGLFKKLFVRIDAQGQQYVNKIVIQEQANNSTTILFRNQMTQPNQLTAVEDALFQLAK
ncbi:outer membrane lipoprotein carrier protein LolA [Acinetobacter suaedae]|uniref:Outer membrane lipoprotein carrier protein LolA n=1 Tax=Acinetobacter suaedae TaxID=2609668 RepID=A0A5P1UR99_9GAMM|nr:outer membrane lipoprotein carrier protein LolA [Acinetobacter sp. C16S1]QER38672.1 outer membrane lipoprotein carrier protein LolA [Acinetobacter sp. C16S1]